MKRWFFAVAVAAVASFMVVATASADVARYQTKTATFTVTQPSGAGGPWTHEYTVTDNPCDNSDTFTGTGVVSGLDYDGLKTFNEWITGTFNSDGTVSFN